MKPFAGIIVMGLLVSCSAPPDEESDSDSSLSAQEEGRSPSKEVAESDGPGSVLNIGGIWEFSEVLSDSARSSICNTQGTFTFDQTGNRFTGSNNQTGTCAVGSRVRDNTGILPITDGLVKGTTIMFKTPGPCTYTGTVSGTPPARISGTAVCGGTAFNSTGPWQAHLLLEQTAQIGPPAQRLDQVREQPKAEPEPQPKTEPKPQPDERLDEFTRKQIYFELAQAQDRALREAERRYPTDPGLTFAWRENINKQIEVERTLSGKYEAELRRKYGISVEEQRRIAFEGAKNRWRLPDL